jgi:hypothetical protein
MTQREKYFSRVRLFFKLDCVSYSQYLIFNFIVADCRFRAFRLCLLYKALSGPA